MITEANSTRPLTIALSLLLAVIIAWMLFYHECASGGAMGGWYRDCTCRGIEHVDYDNTAADSGVKPTWQSANAALKENCCIIQIVVASIRAMTFVTNWTSTTSNAA
jgi:hypothetical protein